MNEVITTLQANMGYAIGAFFLFSAGVAIVEFIIEWRQKQLSKWRFKEMLSSLMVFLPAQLLKGITGAITFVAFYFIADLVPWKIPVNGWTVLLAIVVLDLNYYWEHRLGHEIRVLWSYHSIHHSSPIYNFSTAYRVSFIADLFAWVFYLPIILIGFDPLVVLLALAFALSYQTWLHTGIIGKLGWFGYIFNTPSHHRVHHGSDEIYLDKNYGAIFIIWDRLFGTFQEETFTPTYGLTKQLETINPIDVHFREMANIVKDVKQARNRKDALKYVFGHPAWKPDEPQQE